MLCATLLPLALAACGAEASKAELDEPPPANLDGHEGDTEGDDGARASNDCVREFMTRVDPYVKGVAEQALELASAASPATRLEVFVALTEPDYDFGNLDIPAREAQLAPYQDPIVVLVEARGGEVVTKFWISNSLVIDLAAQHLPDVFCWPEIRTVEVSTPYWDAVTPYWDLDSVGLEECPLTGETCPEHCSAFSGERLDEARGCLVPVRAVGCDRNPTRIVTADEKCRIDTRTGERFRFGGLGPLEPAFLGWSECDDAAHAQVISAPRCE